MQTNSPAHTYLVIDDDMVDRQVLTRHLKGGNEQCKIHEAEDVLEAVQICHLHHVDCVLIDYHLPYSDGLDGIIQLKKMIKNAPIIMVSGVGDAVIAAHAVRVGAHDFISKANLTHDALMRVIETSTHYARMEHDLREQNDAMQQFNRVLAHDLRAPISRMNSFIDMVREAIRNNRLDQADEYMAYAKQAADISLEMITTLSSYAKTGVDTQFGIVDMNTLMSDIRMTFGDVIKEGNVQLRIQGNLPAIYGSRSLVYQVFCNLVANAMKYNRSARPEIDIRVEKDSGTHVLFAVSDNGVGIPANRQEDIFERSVRLNMMGDEGLGLGLASCRRAVERHHGRIWCEDNPGKPGSVFYIFLPKTRDGMAEDAIIH